jgi:flavin-binding protein dodecin
MAYAINSKSQGVFIGIGMGLAFFSQTETAGQYIACTSPTSEDAQKTKDMLEEASTTLNDLEIVEVASGHWKDLQAAGLHIGDMATNQLMVQEPVGAC